MTRYAIDHQPPASTTGTPSQPGPLRVWFDRAGVWYLFVAPSLLLLAVFFFLPAASAVFRSFYEWDGEHSWFVGLDNFRDIFADPTLRDGTRNLIILTAALLFVGTVVPLVVAEFIFSLRSARWRQIYQVAFLIPGLVPVIVVILLWKFLYDPYFGPLNAILMQFGFDRLDFLWLAGPRSALYCLIFIGFPWVAGTSVLIYLAGLNNIPASVLDACRLEGLGGVKRFLTVDVFFLTGQIKLLVIVGFIGLLQSFVLQLVVTQGGPGTATTVPAHHLFETAFLYDRLGYASAIGLVLAVIILAFSLLNLKFIKTMEL